MRLNCWKPAEVLTPGSIEGKMGGSKMDRGALRRLVVGLPQLDALDAGRLHQSRRCH